MTQDEIDYTKLAAQIDPSKIAAEMDTGKVAEDRFMLSRRQLAAIAGSGLGAGVLSALGIGEASAQTAAGTIGTNSQPVTVEALDLNVQGSITGGAKEARVSLSSQTSASPIPFDSSILDPGSNFDTSTNEYIVPEPGVYFISLNVLTRDSGQNTYNIQKNGTAEAKIQKSNADSFDTMSVTDIISANSGDSIDFTNDDSRTLQQGDRNTFAAIGKLG
jgi:hypothetical protein